MIYDNLFAKAGKTKIRAGLIGTGTYGEADIGLCQCRRVIYAISNHTHFVAIALQSLYDAGLVPGQHPAMYNSYAELLCDGLSSVRMVAGAHHQLYAP